MTEWEWDETLYAGSAPYYAVGRMPYPPELAEAIGAELGLDGRGRLLDVGCGPGSLTLVLAPLFEAVVGVDADRGMVAEASRRAREAGVTTARWVHARAEELPPDLGTFRVATFAQSFHWMDRSAVAERVRGLLEPGGVWLHVGATTHQGVDGDDPLPRPRPPWDRINTLVAEYLGPVRRAGQSALPQGTRSGEDEVMRRAGYSGPTRFEVGGDRVVDRSVDQITAGVFSLSSSAPHLFGAELPGFEADLRRLLTEASDDGWFAERTRPIAVLIWRP
ncbi:Methyltransferase domain-containing protein [Cryptosporangium aurantiacum]|uniref:Methyltransferase domain-containing protein n=1 Tax=Cryptosporangium aurantiacum TaxID=134849 RepID=A0A1M7RLK9_9ACTN|nr:class I SAM-dependent methyltransferase [Cryptosporangium aurantiacum]SHN47069.1 Methyltransferase domain-containing protein [Cryptosporangium aurantiacum]